MQLKNDSSVCSLLRLSGFGEKTPAGNGHDSGYNTFSPVAVTYEQFCAEVYKKITGWNGGSYNSPVKNASSIMAIVIDKQPIARKFLQDLVENCNAVAANSASEFYISEYGKYPHGISYFHFYPPTFIEVVKKGASNA